MDLFLEVRQIADALDMAKVDYAICGGVALAIHGLPRATKDIDLMARREDVPRLRDAVRACGFTLEAFPMTFSSSGITIQRLTKVDPSGAHLTLDVLFADAPLDVVWKSRIQVAHEHGSLWVVSRKGLITLKVTAGRPQDIVDVQRLEETDREHEP